MTTLDEILGGSSPNRGYAPKGSQEWAEQNSGENAPVSSSPTAQSQSKAKSKPSSGAGAPVSGGGGGGYEELFKKLNPYTPLTEEEKAKEQKKRRRDEIISAIGDGVAALSNLYFTTQGAPNMYTGKNTMSEATKVRYDKLLKEREANETAYLQGMLRAKQADDEASRAERSWQRQLALDQEAKDRYQEQFEYRKERDEAEDDYREKSLETKKEIADDKLEAEKNKQKVNSGSGGNSSGGYPTPDGKVLKTKAAAVAHMRTLGYGSPEPKIKRSTQYSSQGRKRGYSETTVEPDYDDWYEYIDNKIGSPKGSNKPQPQNQNQKPQKRTKPIKVVM